MSTADIVNTWFAERIANGAIARYTEAYNQAAAALPDLIQRLGCPAPTVATDPIPVAEKEPAADPAPEVPTQGSSADKSSKA